MDDISGTEEEMHLLRDSFVNEGFLAEVSRFNDPPKAVLWISKKDDSTRFSVEFSSETGEYTVRDPDDHPLGMKFQELSSAVAHGCDLFSIFPSWEMEKFPLLWEHLMEED